MTDLSSGPPDDVADRLVHLDRAQAVHRVLHGLAHDLRNHLQVVALAASLDRGGADSELATRIEDAIDAMSEGFSLLGRLGRDLDDEPAHARLGPCLDQLRILEGLQRSVPRVRLEVVAPDESLGVRVPESVLVHVLLALVTNGKEAAADRPNGVVTVAVTVEPADRLVVTIADSGGGFGDRSTEPEPFRSSRPARDHGGIGLAAATRLLVRYGGVLEMQNGANGGAVARVVVPRG